MPSSDVWRRALEGAFVLHFGKLFEVLLIEKSDAAFKQFMTGMTMTVAMYDKIEKHISIMQKNERAGS